MKTKHHFLALSLSYLVHIVDELDSGDALLLDLMHHTADALTVTDTHKRTQTHADTHTTLSRVPRDRSERIDSTEIISEYNLRPNHFCPPPPFFFRVHGDDL